jgi:hypothetical protein
LKVTSQLIARPAPTFRFVESIFLFFDRKTGDDSMGRPGETGPAIVWRNPTSDGLVPLNHVGGDAVTFAHLVEDFAETVVSGVEEVANPPGACSLTPEREAEGPLPFFDRRFALNADSAWFEIESTDLE